MAKLFKVLDDCSSMGQSIIEKGSRYVGTELRQVYDKWSQKKQDAYDECYQKYIHTTNRDAFSICSANSYSFTCSWIGLYDGQDALFYETSKNSYVVLFS